MTDQFLYYMLYYDLLKVIRILIMITDPQLMEISHTIGNIFEATPFSTFKKEKNVLPISYTLDVVLAQNY